MARTLLRGVRAALVAAAATLIFATPASAHVVVAGHAWLGGHGVDVCYPSTGSCPDSPVGGVAAAPFQCVELAQRLYTRLGWYPGIFAGVASAYQIYGWAPRHGMAAHRNGSGYVPVPGDMIVSGGSSAVPDGHVAIVDTVDLAAGVVHAVEQNASPSGRSTYRLHGSRLSRPGAYGNVIGVVHSPRDHFAGGGWDGQFHDGWLYRSRSQHALYLVAGGARFAVAGSAERALLGYARARVQLVPGRALVRLPTVPRSGTLLRAPGVSGLWLIHRGRRFAVTSQAGRHLWTVPASGLEQIPTGTTWRSTADRTPVLTH